MFKNCVQGCAALLLAGTVTSAEALTIMFNPADVLFPTSASVACTGDVPANTTSATTCASLSFTYTLPGYTNPPDTLLSGSLSLFFYDDNDPGPDVTGQQEEVKISLDGVVQGTSFTITTGSTAGTPYSPAPFNVLAQLLDGSLVVLLEKFPSGATSSSPVRLSRRSGPKTDLGRTGTLRCPSLRHCFCLAAA